MPINKTSYTLVAKKEDVRCKEYDKHLRANSRTKRLLVHEGRLIVKDGILMRKQFGEVTRHQILIPEHLITDSSSLKAIHGQMGKHPGMTKTSHECRSKWYCPGKAKRIKGRVQNCEDCIEYKRINNCQHHRTCLEPGRLPKGRHPTEPTQIHRLSKFLYQVICVFAHSILLSNSKCNSKNN